MRQVLRRTKTFERLEVDGIRYSIAVRAADARIAATISEIPEGEWTKLEGYPEPGLAEIVETTYGGRRLLARRVRELSDQQQLLAGWRHHPFITNRTEAIAVVEACHRRHAVVELANAIFEYIESFHNSRRRHSSLNMPRPQFTGHLGEQSDHATTA